MWFLRFLILLALIVWIGGIIFFAFVLAPTLFSVLPTTKLAGDVVNATLTKLHWMGLVSGVVFLISSLGYNWQKHQQLRMFGITQIFVVLMLVLTSYSQFSITPRMRAIRGQIAQMNSQPGVPDFDKLMLDKQFFWLHKFSTWAEEGVLFLGLGVVVLTARRFGNSS
jgi:uncharacterized membrane protein